MRRAVARVDARVSTLGSSLGVAPLVAQGVCSGKSIRRDQVESFNPNPETLPRVFIRTQAPTPLRTSHRYKAVDNFELQTISGKPGQKRSGVEVT